MNQREFKALLLPLQASLYATAIAILKNENDAADCLQETFTKLWERRERLRQIENPAAYAVVTVRHVAISMKTRGIFQTASLADASPEIADPSAEPDRETEGKDDLRKLTGLLSKLPENQRKVVVMSAVSGMTNTEIRDATGLSDDNVRVLLSRGRKRLRELFSLNS